MPFSQCISSFEATSYKTLQGTATQFFLFLIALHQFLHQKMSFFNNISELNSKLSKKRFLSQMSLF